MKSVKQTPAIKNQMKRKLHLKESDWTATIYQKYTRPRDVNGNPYCLFVLFNARGEIVKGVECRQSIPNYANSTEIKTLGELPEISLSSSEYNRLKKDILDLEYSH